MKGSKTKKIIALMLIIWIIIATSNGFINKVFAATLKTKTVTLSENLNLDVSISIVDNNGDPINLDEIYVGGFKTFKELRFRVLFGVDKNSRLVAVDAEGNEADILSDLKLTPRFSFKAGIDYFKFDPVKVWIEENGMWIFEYKIKELDIKNFLLGCTLTQFRLSFVCQDSSYNIMFDTCDYQDLSSFGDEIISYSIKGLINDDIPPYMTVKVNPSNENEIVYCKKGTKINISVFSTDFLTDINEVEEIDPRIVIKFKDGAWKDLDCVKTSIINIMDDEGHIFSAKYDYEYEIKEDDYGKMSVYFRDNQGYDNSQNMAIFDPVYSITGEGYKTGIYADSIAPTATLDPVTNSDGSVTVKVTFDEGNVIITNNEGKNTYTFTENGEFIFEFEDKAGNKGTAKAEVTSIQTKEPKVEFKSLETKEESGKVYVKVGQDSTVDSIKSDIDKDALVGKTVEIENLTEDGKIKTGSKITIDGEVQCIIAVNGDVDGDGKIDFIGDVIRANNYRLELINIDVEQELASDIDDDGKVDFIKDLMRINNYRLGLIDSL